MDSACQQCGSGKYGGEAACSSRGVAINPVSSLPVKALPPIAHRSLGHRSVLCDTCWTHVEEFL